MLCDTRYCAALVQLSSRSSFGGRAEKQVFKVASSNSWMPLKVLCSFASDQTVDSPPTSLTSSPDWRGSAGGAEVIAPAISLTTLCAIFKMTSVTSLHYSWIAPSLPVNKNLSFCARGQRLPLRLDDAAEDLRRFTETALEFNDFFFFNIWCFHVSCCRVSSAFATVLQTLRRKTFLFCLQYSFTM